MKGIRERERERNSQTDEKIGRRRYEREREGGRKEGRDHQRRIQRFSSFSSLNTSPLMLSVSLTIPP